MGYSLGTRSPKVSPPLKHFCETLKSLIWQFWSARLKSWSGENFKDGIQGLHERGQGRIQSERARLGELIYYCRRSIFRLRWLRKKIKSKWVTWSRRERVVPQGSMCSHRQKIPVVLSLAPVGSPILLCHWWLCCHYFIHI